MEQYVVGSIRAPLLENEAGASRAFTALDLVSSIPTKRPRGNKNFPCSAGPLGRHFSVEITCPRHQPDDSPKARKGTVRALATCDTPKSPTAERPRHYSRKFSVVEVAGGQARRLELQTPELLRQVHCHNQKKQLEDATAGCLKLRDLRQVCTSPAVGAQRASISPRRNCILINVPPFVRCIILHDRVLFILKLTQEMDFLNDALRSHTPPHADRGNFPKKPGWFSSFGGWLGGRRRTLTHEQLAFERRRSVNLNSSPLVSALPYLSVNSSERSLESDTGRSVSATAFRAEWLATDATSRLESSLFEKVRQLTEMKTRAPLEFSVVEAVLVEVCTELIAEVMPIKRAADKALESASKNPSDTVLLHQVSDLKRRVDSATDRVKGLCEAVEEVLVCEEDLIRLEISRFWESPSDWEHPVRSAKGDDLEMLLECYAQEAQSLLRLLRRVDEELDDALRFMDLHLASVRNTFLKAEIGLDFVGVVVGFMAVVTGIYGMNIPNGWESNVLVFKPVSLSISVTCGAVVLLAFVFFRRLRL